MKPTQVSQFSHLSNEINNGLCAEALSGGLKWLKAVKHLEHSRERLGTAATIVLETYPASDVSQCHSLPQERPSSRVVFSVPPGYEPLLSRA